ncbi:putative NIF/NLI interacting factor [Frog virus 3]
MQVFLDLDETLIHSIPVSRLGWTKSKPYPVKPFTVQDAGTPLSVMMGSSKAVNDGRNRLATRLSLFKRTVLTDHIMCWRPTLRTFLNGLFASGYKINVWTAASKPYALEVVKALNLKSYGMGLLVTAQDYPKGSVKRLKYLTGLDAVKIPLSNTAIVDDREDVKRAQPTRAVHIKPFTASSANTACSESDELKRVTASLAIIAGRSRSRRR